uniref:Endonuclease V n=1 Tax=Catharus ustulatus TaxID=91951 RepID=A0A8C3Y2B8_CATUS
MVAVTAPYVAGFLAFREVPVLVEAVQRLQQEEPQLQPQVGYGNGLLHPRGFGTACHLGVLTELPCIGVAKNLLHVDGLVRDELHREQVRSLQRSGETFPLIGTSGKVLGMVTCSVPVLSSLTAQVLRSCNNSSKPLYVSVGHRVSLGTAVRLVRACCRFRIPEPIRQVRTAPGAGSSWGRQLLGLGVSTAELQFPVSAPVPARPEEAAGAPYVTCSSQGQMPLQSSEPALQLCLFKGKGKHSLWKQKGVWELVITLSSLPAISRICSCSETLAVPCDLFLRVME